MLAIHMFYYIISFPALLIIWAIEYFDGGSIIMLKNLSFIGGMPPFIMIQLMLSLITVSAIIAMGVIILKNPNACNPYDYFDIIFQIFSRCMIIASKYATFSP